MDTGAGPNDTIFERRESSVRSYCRAFDVVFDTARGSIVTDTEGREYIDFLAGCSTLNYGHNDADMAAALVDHLARGTVSHGLDLHTGVKADFLTAFERYILEPRGLDHRVQFTGPTGTNAVEAALKVARAYTGRTNVIAFTNAFHGVTGASLAVTANRGMRMAPYQPLAGVSRALYDGYLGGDVDTADILETMLDDPSGGFDDPAAIIVETVQGEGGLGAARAEWLSRVARIARNHGALFIVDDIQAGCGRTGTFFSFENMGVEPDIVTLSKSLSGFGLPLAVVLLRPEFDIWSPGQHNGTFRGNSLAFVTARVALEKYWADSVLTDKVVADGHTVKGALTRIAEMIPDSQLKGRGMFQGVDVVSGEVAAAICRRAFELGLIIETSGPHDEVVKVLAPLTTPAETLQHGLDLLVSAAADVVPSMVGVLDREPLSA